MPLPAAIVRGHGQRLEAGVLAMGKTILGRWFDALRRQSRDFDPSSVSVGSCKEGITGSRGRARSAILLQMYSFSEEKLFGSRLIGHCLPSTRTHSFKCLKTSHQHAVASTWLQIAPPSFCAGESRSVSRNVAASLTPGIHPHVTSAFSTCADFSQQAHFFSI